MFLYNFIEKIKFIYLFNTNKINLFFYWYEYIPMYIYFLINEHLYHFQFLWLWIMLLWKFWYMSGTHMQIFLQILYPLVKLYIQDVPQQQTESCFNSKRHPSSSIEFTFQRWHHQKYQIYVSNTFFNVLSTRRWDVSVPKL